MIPTISLLLAIAALLLLARRNLWMALCVAALVVGVFNLPLRELARVALLTVADPGVLYLGLAVGIIPLMGGLLQESGALVRMVDTLSMRRDLFLATGPAFLGLLPIPGGALLSAPLVMRAGADIPDTAYAAINVWFRHLLTFIYPLAALLVCAQMAGLNPVTAVLWLLPFFALLFVLGWVFLLRGIKGRLVRTPGSRRRDLLLPAGIILAAPGLYMLLRRVLPALPDQLALVIGVSTGLVPAMAYTRCGFRFFGRVARKMKPWYFFLLIVAIFFFLNVFSASPLPTLIAGMQLPHAFTLVVVSALVGLLTARTQAAMALMLPIIVAKWGALSYLSFSLLYTSLFMGYMISPLHPCILVTLQFYGCSLRGFYRHFLLPGLITIGVTYIAALLLL